VGNSETGLVIFMGEQRAIAVAPPFPLVADALYDGYHTSSLVEILQRDLVIGVVLLRLGRYAIGVLSGDTLVASKTDTRYVKSRHRAGGSSQRRFERSRERLVRELFDKTCQVTRDVFSPYHSGIDYLLMGGERHTLRGFVQRCRYLKSLQHKTLERLLRVERPGQRALEGIARAVWVSRVFTFDLLRI
jgi:peptide subunit release factor 1 (eRF1)